MIRCLMYFSLFVRVLCLYLICYALHCVHSSFLNHLEEEEKNGCCAIFVLQIVTINVLWLFLTVWWVGPQCVIMVFPDLNH